MTQLAGDNRGSARIGHIDAALGTESPSILSRSKIGQTGCPPVQFPEELYRRGLAF